MSSYQQFAYIYDSLMKDIPYSKYAEWVAANAPAEKGAKLLDVGCGTGVLSMEFAKMGYEVIGVDLSEDMLAVAQSRCIENKVDVTFLCQSMSMLDGLGEIDIAVIAIDSLNYLEDLKEVKETFQGIYDSLNNNGHLFFDVHSLYKMDIIYPDGPFTYEDEEVAYIWHTEPGEEQHSIYHDITFFVKDHTGYYQRFEESHYQRTFPLEVYTELLKEVGFRSISISDSVFEDSHEDVQRYFFHAIK